jgi:hypothetical protein
MAKKAKAQAARLEALHALGDLAGLRAEARRVLEAPESSEEDREAARAALAWSRPEPGAAVAAAVGLVLFAVVAILGIVVRR